MNDILDTEFSDKPVVVSNNRVQVGDDINIIQLDPTLKRIHIGFGWDLTNFNSDDVDMDVSLFMLDKHGQTREDGDFVFYNNMVALEGAVTHNGDSRTGAGEGDDESMTVDLTGVPFDIINLVFVLSIYKGFERGHHVDAVHNAFIRVANADTNMEILRFELDEYIKDRQEVSMIMGSVNREGPKWHFVPKADFYDGGLAEIATKYGIIVAQAG